MVTWGSQPQRKVEAGVADISSDSITVEVHRPENAISYVLLSANDYKGKNYIANIDAFTVIKVSTRYAGDAWTQVFGGVTERIGPKLSETGQTLELTAYGYGRALRNTHCVSNYGKESEDPLLDTPHEIWDDIIDNQINLSFGGAATGYAITKNKIAPAALPSINFLEGGYRNAFTVINNVLTAYQGYRNGLSGMHWFVDESNNLFINTIAAHENDASGWPTWWRTDQAGSTLVEGVDFNNTFFHKKVTDFANKIVLYCDLRKPGTDVWTEDGGPVWGNDGLTSVGYEVTEFIVGSHSLECKDGGVGHGDAYYPSTEDAAWDFTKIGSPENPPTINFYLWKDDDFDELSSTLRLFTTDHDNDYYESAFSAWTEPDDEWIHRSLTVGPYWKSKDESRIERWAKVNNADWANINGLSFYIIGQFGFTAYLYIDDLHFAGKIIREAYNSTNITANDEVQKILRYDVAVDDSLTAADDTGTAGQLAYGELLTRQVIPTVGIFTTPLAEDVLPGQLIHIHSDWYSAGNWRINSDFRVKEAIHSFIPNKPATTTWDVTSDVLNTFVPGYNDALSTYHKIMHTDPDLKNMKTTGLDPYVTRLSLDYP